MVKLFCHHPAHRKWSLSTSRTVWRLPYARVELNRKLSFTPSCALHPEPGTFPRFRRSLFLCWIHFGGSGPFKCFTAIHIGSTTYWMNVDFYSDQDAAKRTLKEMVDAMVQEFLQPTENELIERSEWTPSIQRSVTLLLIPDNRWPMAFRTKLG